jgi:hypothetical protein
LETLKSRIPTRFRPLAKRVYLRLLPPGRRHRVAAGFRSQAYWCRRFGSPLYGYLLERAADDIDRKRAVLGRPPRPAPTAAGADDSLPAQVHGGLFIGSRSKVARLSSLHISRPLGAHQNPGDPPPFSIEATVAERRGCDAAPLDPRSDDDRLTLLSFVWPRPPSRG